MKAYLFYCWCPLSRQGLAEDFYKLVYAESPGLARLKVTKYLVGYFKERYESGRSDVYIKNMTIP